VGVFIYPIDWERSKRYEVGNWWYFIIRDNATISFRSTIRNSSHLPHKKSLSRIHSSDLVWRRETIPRHIAEILRDMHRPNIEISDRMVVDSSPSSDCLKVFPCTESSVLMLAVSSLLAQLFLTTRAAKVVDIGNLCSNLEALTLFSMVIHDPTAEFDRSECSLPMPILILRSCVQISHRYLHMGPLHPSMFSSRAPTSGRYAMTE
jgi:hypothetical protein